MSRLKRPLGVWLICVFYVLSIASTLISLAAVLTGTAELTPAQQRYFASLGPVDYLGNVLILAISGWAIFELFELRKAAVRALIIVLIMNLGLTAFHLLATNWVEAVGSSGIYRVVVSWAVLAVVLVYAWMLQREGVLV